MLSALGINGTFQQSGTASTGKTVTMTRAVPAGHTLTMSMVNNAAAGATISTVSDTKGNTWFAVNSTATTNMSAALYICFVTIPLTTSDSVSVTWSASGANAAAVYEYAGTSSDFAGTPLKSNAGSTTASTNLTSSSYASTLAGRYGQFFSVCGISVNAAQTAASGWFNQQNTAIGTVAHFQYSERVVAASIVGTETAGSSWTGSASVALIGAVILAGPEMMHDPDRSAYYRRKSGLILPRPAVYRGSR